MIVRGAQEPASASGAGRTLQNEMPTASEPLLLKQTQAGILCKHKLHSCCHGQPCASAVEATVAPITQLDVCGVYAACLGATSASLDERLPADAALDPACGVRQGAGLGIRRGYIGTRLPMHTTT